MTCSIILFVQSLKTPKLQDQKRNELEGEITLVECKVGLRTLSSGKSPGEDGFAWEFYNCFFDLPGQDLVKLIVLMRHMRKAKCQFHSEEV